MSLTDSATPARGSHSPASTHEPPRWLRVLAVPGMLLVGVIVAVQSHVNGQLREELGSGLQSSVLTAMMTFCVGCVLTALVVVAAMQIMGVILVVAMLVVPVAAATQIAGSFRGSLALAVGAGEIAVVAGLTLSYLYGLATGGIIVLCAIGVFAGCALAGRSGVID